MNSKYYPRLLTLGLSLALVEVGVAQTSRSAALAAADPSGLAMTVTAVSVVFTALILLSVIFTLLGRLMQRLAEKPETAPQSHTEYRPASAPTSSGTPSSEAMVAIALALETARGTSCTDEVALAISMALHAYASDQHDMESYRLTFRRSPSQWSARALGMRPQLPSRY